MEPLNVKKGARPRIVTTLHPEGKLWSMLRTEPGGGGGMDAKIML